MPHLTKHSAHLDPNIRQKIVLINLDLAIGTCYLIVFAFILIFQYHKYWLGAIHVLDMLLVVWIYLHTRRTKNVNLATSVMCLMVLITIIPMAIDGGVNATGIYFVLPASILIFFLTGSMRGVFWAAGMFIPFFTAGILAALGIIDLPYTNANFMLFLFSYVLSFALIYLYSYERDRLDEHLTASVREASQLARSLQQQKTLVADQVRLRTRQYQAERAKLAASIEGLYIGFITLDREMNILSINKAGQAILAPLPGPNLTDISARFGTKLNLSVRVATAMRLKKSVHLTDITLDNRFLTVTVTPVTDGQAVLGAVVLLEDVSELKTLERSRDEFFSIASHELRTPLTAIMGNASIMLRYFDRMDANERKEMLADVSTSGKRLITIVNDFLDSTRLEQGKFKFKLEPVDTRDLANEVIEELKIALPDNKIKLGIKATEQLPVMAIADRNRLKQVLTNLVGNSIKYTEQGSVTVGLAHKGSSVHITIEDTGKGVPVESQALLFHKFQQASNNSMARDTTKSTGLGLYICKMLAEGMKGKLYLERSVQDVGSTFVVTLPAAEDIKTS